MIQSPTLIALARKILVAAENLEKDSCGPDTLEQHVESRKTILSASYTLQNLVASGPQLLERQQIAFQTLSCLDWLVRFEIFTYVPLPDSLSNKPAAGHGLPKSITYAKLAGLASVPLSRLQSVVRMAITTGLFHEVEQGSGLAHTSLSASFVMDKSLRNWVRFMCRYSSPTAAQMSEATARWGNTTAKNQTAHNIASNTPLPWFDYVKATPGLPEIFAEFMQSMVCSDAGKLKHLVNGYDWQGLGENVVVVDVGGSTGLSSIALAEAFPNLHFVVQDLAEVVAAGPGMLSRLEAQGEEKNRPNLSSRIKFVAHDFFEPQPEPDPAATSTVYLLRKILHDWPFDQARRILQQLATAICHCPKESARIIIMDTILPLPGSIEPYEEAYLRYKDLTMVQCFNSGERELSEWEALLRSTEPKLKIKSFNCPLGSNAAIIEAVI